MDTQTELRSETWHGLSPGTPEMILTMIGEISGFGLTAEYIKGQEKIKLAFDHLGCAPAPAMHLQMHEMLVKECDWIEANSHFCYTVVEARSETVGVSMAVADFVKAMSTFNRQLVDHPLKPWVTFVLIHSEADGDTALLKPKDRDLLKRAAVRLSEATSRCLEAEREVEKARLAVVAAEDELAAANRDHDEVIKNCDVVIQGYLRLQEADRRFSINADVRTGLKKENDGSPAPQGNEPVETECTTKPLKVQEMRKWLGWFGLRVKLNREIRKGRPKYEDYVNVLKEVTAEEAARATPNQLRTIMRHCSVHVGGSTRIELARNTVWALGTIP